MGHSIVAAIVNIGRQVSHQSLQGHQCRMSMLWQGPIWQNIINMLNFDYVIDKSEKWQYYEPIYVITGIF